MLRGILKYSLVTQPGVFHGFSIKGPHIFSGGLYVQSGLLNRKRNLNKHFGVIFKFTIIQAFHRDHRPIGGVVQAAKLVFFRLVSNQIHQLIKREVLVHVNGNQTALFFLDNADFRQIHFQQRQHILAMIVQRFPHCFQMRQIPVQIGYFFLQKLFHAGGRTILHKYPDFVNGHIQLPQQQNGFQDGTLIITVIPVSVPGMDSCRVKQANFIIPHQRFLVDAVEGRKLTDGEQFTFFLHFSFYLLTVQLLYGL